jgi:hypothetical protein
MQAASFIRNIRKFHSVLSKDPVEMGLNRYSVRDGAQDPEALLGWGEW